MSKRENNKFEQNVIDQHFVFFVNTVDNLKIMSISISKSSHRSAKYHLNVSRGRLPNEGTINLIDMGS
jgi:hypothetical protein